MMPMHGAHIRPNPRVPSAHTTMMNTEGRTGARFPPNGGATARPMGISHGQIQPTFQSPNENNNLDFSPEGQRLMKVDKSKPMGWATMDGVIIPYIMRGSDKYVSVKMVESKLLSKFPKINMEDMSNVGPIYSYYITDNEAKLLTEINTHCYKHGFGAKSFTTKDLIVSLENFTNFYNRAKKHFESKTAGETPVPTSSPGMVNASSSKASYQERIDGGWVQINNTVVPYLLRLGVKFVPLSVIKYAAGLLTDVRMGGYKIPCTEQEYHFLNTCCRAAHINFTFSIKTKLIKMEHVIRMSQSKVNITELPPYEPFTHAQYQFERQQSAESGPMPHVSGNYQMPLMQPQLSPQMQAHISPPTVMPLQQHMPPRNPFIPQVIRPGLGGPGVVQHAPPPPPPPYRPRGAIPFMRGPSPMATAMARDMRTPSPSISPRTQANMGLPGRSQKAQSNSNSSTPSSRPSSAQSRNSVTPPSVQNQSATAARQRDGTIKVFQFEGKNLSCLMRSEEKEPYALLEALVRLYFPQCSLSDFQSALEQVLNVPVQQLSAEEEMAFIRFYELNVKSLRSKAIVSFASFKEYYGQLQYIFKTSDSTSPSETSQDGADDGNKDDVSSIKDVMNNNINQGDHMNSRPAAVNNIKRRDSDAMDSQCSIDLALGQSGDGCGKRKATNQAPSTRKSKQICKRLEDTVAMLRMRQGPTSADHPEERITPELSAEKTEELRPASRGSPDNTEQEQIMAVDTPGETPTNDLKETADVVARTDAADMTRVGADPVEDSSRAFEPKHSESIQIMTETSQGNGPESLPRTTPEGLTSCAVQDSSFTVETKRVESIQMVTEASHDDRSESPTRITSEDLISRTVEDNSYAVETKPDESIRMMTEASHDNRSESPTRITSEDLISRAVEDNSYSVETKRDESIRMMTEASQDDRSESLPLITSEDQISRAVEDNSYAVETKRDESVRMMTETSQDDRSESLPRITSEDQISCAVEDNSYAVETKRDESIQMMTEASQDDRSESRPLITSEDLTSRSVEDGAHTVKTKRNGSFQIMMETSQSDGSAVPVNETAGENETSGVPPGTVSSEGEVEHVVDQLGDVSPAKPVELTIINEPNQTQESESVTCEQADCVMDTAEKMDEAKNDSVMHQKEGFCSDTAENECHLKRDTSMAQTQNELEFREECLMKGVPKVDDDSKADSLTDAAEKVQGLNNECLMEPTEKVHDLKNDCLSIQTEKVQDLNSDSLMYLTEKVEDVKEDSSIESTERVHDLKTDMSKESTSSQELNQVPSLQDPVPIIPQST